MAILYIAMAFIKYTYMYMALRFLRSVQFVVPSEARASLELTNLLLSEARASQELTNPLLGKARASLELTNPLLRDHRPPCWNKRHRMPWQPSLQKVRRAFFPGHYFMYLIFFIFLPLLLSLLTLLPRASPHSPTSVQ